MHNLLIANRLNLVPKSNPGRVLKVHVYVILNIFKYAIAIVLYSDTLLVNARRKLKEMKFDQIKIMYHGAFNAHVRNKHDLFLILDKYFVNKLLKNLRMT